MKYLRSRTEIADAINIKRYPVLTIDLREPLKGYPNCYAGSKVNVAGGHSGRYTDLLTRCTIEMFGDEPGNGCHDEPWRYQKIILTGSCVSLHASFTMDDVLSDIEWSNARTVKPGDTVVVFFRTDATGYLRLMKVSDHINPHCQTVATLIDID